ncbi:hypothetical protein F5Y04DRAFT_282739 [Hypomontagnella monticulosa]|nr:hypothetical protein F5Y04DRAFT_282739 [Hypomontagnella monticulosa]
MNISSRFALLTIFTCAAFGWDPSQRDCDNHPLCLTSFKWCDVNGEGCYFPDGAYPTTANPTHDESLYALLLENKKFTISWKTRPQKKDVPVRVQWAIDGGATWEKNTTDSQVAFHPSEILASLPWPSAPDLTTSKATFDVMNDITNVITISQPWPEDESQSLNPKVNQFMDTSDRFIIGLDLMERFLTAQNDIGHRDEYNRWKVGVGIGVGVGVPFLITVMALIIWEIAKRAAREPSRRYKHRY